MLPMQAYCALQPIPYTFFTFDPLDANSYNQSMTSKERYLCYLQTEHWGWLRQEVFDRFGRHCFCCGSQEEVEPHHLIYRSLYDCIPDDLMPLCRQCYKVCHSAIELNKEHYSQILRLSPPVRRQSVVAFIKARYFVTGANAPHGPNSIELNRVRLTDQPHRRRFMDYAEYQRKHAT